MEASTPVPEFGKRTREGKPVTQVQIRQLAHQLGYNIGAGVHKAISDYVSENLDSLDTSRNVQWTEVDLDMNQQWFSRAMRGKSKERRTRMMVYVKDLIVSVIVGASRLAQAEGRKTIKKSYVALLLAFLDDVY